MNVINVDMNFYSLLPELLILLGAIVPLFIRGSAQSRIISYITTTITVVFILASVTYFWGCEVVGFDGVIVKDNMTLLFQVLAAMVVLISMVLSQGDLQKRGNHGEYHSLLLFSLFGISIIAAAKDLLVIFIGMEILSMSLYVLVGFFKDSSEGMEASIKYFLLGSFASAIFLLGIAFYYGASGTTSFKVLADATSLPTFFYAGIALIMVGLGFKIAAVPFHMWAPDAYEGAPISVASFISVAPKIASFAVLLTIATNVPGYGHDLVLSIIVLMAVTSMIIGNFAALKQSGMVRMLAYSGIAQVGYMLIGLLAIPGNGGAALTFYLFVYIFMNMGAFVALGYLSREKEGRVMIEDLSGLSSRHPGIAFALTVFMISLAGIPPTGGFFGKFYIFKVGIEAGYLAVVIIAIITTVVSFFYYIRVVMLMYMSEEEGYCFPVRNGLSIIGATMVAMVVITFLSGIVPDRILQIAISVFS